MNSPTPKLSVIMPVYNVAPYLRAAIDSVLNQTLTDIELICVDDASTDDCLSILREYEKQDSRLRVIALPQNSGSVVARKRAVEQAAGTYIMMLDSDDELLPRACETVWKEMQRHPADILAFSVDVEPCADITQQQADEMAARLNPYKGTLDQSLLQECFLEEKFAWNLWNKAYRTELCKKAFAFASEQHRTLSDDVYLAFFLLYFARSYRSMKPVLYHYYLGRGVSGHNTFPLSRFRKFCETASIYTELKEFLDRQNDAQKDHYRVLKQLRSRAFRDCIYIWLYNVSRRDAPEAYRALLQCWGGEEVISRLAVMGWQETDRIQRCILPADSASRKIHATGKPVKTIGTFYFRMANGGVERVLSLTIPLWLSMGYRVVLFTDLPPQPEDYAIPPQVERIVLPEPVYGDRDSYRARYRAWEQAVQTYQVDTIVYCAWCSPNLLWDCLTLKALDLNLVAWTHNTYSFFFRLMDPARFRLYRTYLLMDRIVALSRVFARFFQTYAPAYYISNWVGLCPVEECSTTSGHEILWVGRLSPEKQPEQALQVFARVCREVPDATLTMVGGATNFDDLQPQADLEALAETLGIQDKVRFVGFVKDPSPYYRRASLMLFTSMYEGFALVLAEAKGHSLPIVSYDLDYLELLRDSRGVILVPQNDVASMAEEVISLLQDDDRRRAVGRAARQSAEAFAAYDFRAAWQQVFDSFTDGTAAEHFADPENAKMLHLLMDEIEIGEQSMSGLSRIGAEEDRLIHSKFMKFARWYWSWKDPLLNAIKRLLGIH